MAVTLGDKTVEYFVGADKVSEMYLGDTVVYRFITGESWMGSSNNRSGKYAFTDLKYVGLGVERTYMFHVKSITGGTLFAGVKHGTWEDDFVKRIEVTKPGWYTFTYTVSGSENPYKRFVICMADGSSSDSTATALTAVGSSGTAVVDQVYVE